MGASVGGSCACVGVAKSVKMTITKTKSACPHEGVGVMCRGGLRNSGDDFESLLYPLYPHFRRELGDRHHVLFANKNFVAAHISSGMCDVPACDVARHIRILDDLMCTHCPRCAEVFYDFDGCFALQCSNTNCTSFFCGWCFTDCEDKDAVHKHVLACPLNEAPDRGYFADERLFHKAQAARKRQGLVAYLKDKVMLELQIPLMERMNTFIDDPGSMITREEIART